MGGYSTALENVNNHENRNHFQIVNNQNHKQTIEINNFNDFTSWLHWILKANKNCFWIWNKCNHLMRPLHYRIINLAYLNVYILDLPVSEFAADALVPRDAQNLFGSALELTLLGKCGCFAGSVGRITFVQITRRCCSWAGWWSVRVLSSERFWCCQQALPQSEETEEDGTYNDLLMCLPWTQSENLRIYLLFRFYVKSMLAVLESQKYMKISRLLTFSWNFKFFLKLKFHVKSEW